METIDPLDEIINRYHSDVSWLISLITDPTGSRYFLDKSRDARLMEFQEQIVRLNDFLKFADNPEKKFKSIHIAGTSGKGSVVMMIAGILRACGLRTGHHISPYLQVCNEKLVVDGKMIKPSEFSRLVDNFRTTYTQWTLAGGPFDSLKYGEAWVALTYYWFGQQALDWAVVETGMGGRYDPTNVLPSLQAVITNIDFDHVESLGPELTDIAHHKAGIIKSDSSVVTAETNQTNLEILRKEAEIKGARLYSLGHDFNYSLHRISSNGATMDIQTPHNTYRSIDLNSPGTYQVKNAALAIASVDVLAQDHDLRVDIEVIKRGLSGLKLPGRFEVVGEEPLVILDGAHNPDKMEALVDSLQVLYPDKRKFAVLGALITKDVRPMVAVLSKIVAGFYITQPNVFGKPSKTTAALANDVQEIAPSLPIHIHEDVQCSIEAACNHLEKNDILIITGSLYLVGEARDLWFPSDQLLKDLEKRPD